MKSTNMGKDDCPSCGGLLEEATSLQGHTPDPGDFTICSHCFAWLKFAPDMALEKITKIDVQSMDKELIIEMYNITKSLMEAKSKDDNI